MRLTILRVVLILLVQVTLDLMVNLQLLELEVQSNLVWHLQQIQEHLVVTLALEQLHYHSSDVRGIMIRIMFTDCQSLRNISLECKMVFIT